MRAIGVIDYGMGNLHSLGKALERVCSATRVEVSYDPDVLMKCDRIVLPGVGGVKACMNELRRLELNEMVREAARTKPLMGICLGMQVMLDHSEENGGVDALGIISGQVRRFPDPPRRPGRRPAPEGAAHGLEPGAAEHADAPDVEERPRQQLVLFRAQLLRVACPAE